MKPKDKHGWKAAMFPKRRRVKARCELCGRTDCACEIRGDDEFDPKPPAWLSRDEARELGLDGLEVLK